MRQHQSIRQGIIAVADITFYTIVNGALRVINKIESENEIQPGVLQTIKKMYPDSEITAAESVNEKGTMVYKVEGSTGNADKETELLKNDGEFIDINSVS